MDAPPVQYVTTSDGYSIAYAVSGEGRSLVLLPEHYTHIQLNWTEETFMLSWLKEISDRFRLIQYDGRGQGMSSRGLRPDHSMLDHLHDLECVVDALGLDRFVLLGRTVQAHAAVRYAAAYRERVEALVLFSVPISGASMSRVFTTAAEKGWDLLLALALTGTGPSDDLARARWRLMQSITLEDYTVIADSSLKSDIQNVLPHVTAPTLVLHPRDYLLRPPEEPMKLAAGIRGARFHLLAGQLPYGNPSESVPLIESFLAGLSSPAAAAGSQHGPANASPALNREPSTGLSGREIEVLRLLAAGKSNAQIAEALVISQNTVIRHVSNIFAKTGAANRAEAATYAARNGFV